MSLKPVFGDVYLPMSQRVAGTFHTGAFSNPGQDNMCVVLVQIDAVEGDTHTLDVTIKTGADGATYGTTVAAGTQMTGAGSQQLITAYIGRDLYAEAEVVVGGTNTPKITFSVAVMVF